jgi:hypothetical protein
MQLDAQMARQHVSPLQQVAPTQEAPEPTQPLHEPHSPLDWQQVPLGQSEAPAVVQAVQAPASMSHTGSVGELQTIWFCDDEGGQVSPLQ